MAVPPRRIVETDRLILREIVPSDAEEFFKLNSDPAVTRYTGDGGTETVEEMRRGLEERPIRDYRVHGYGRWAAIWKANDRLIGMAGLKFLEELNDVDIGYRFFPEYWGQGLATEAARACVDYGFNVLRLPHILGLVESENVASVRVLTKLGFVYDQMIDYRSEMVAKYVLQSSAYAAMERRSP